MINKEEISLHFRTASCEEQEDPYGLNFFNTKNIQMQEISSHVENCKDPWLIINEDDLPYLVL